MCLGALSYAAPEQVHYAAGRDQEAEHWGDGGHYMTLWSFDDEYAKPASAQNLPPAHVSTDDPTAAFRLWTSQNDG